MAVTSSVTSVISSSESKDITSLFLTVISSSSNFQTRSTDGFNPDRSRSDSVRLTQPADGPVTNSMIPDFGLPHPDVPEYVPFR